MSEVIPLKVVQFRIYTCIVLNFMEEHSAGIQSKLLTGTIVVINSEKEVFVVKNSENIKENIEKLSEVAPLDGI